MNASPADQLRLLEIADLDARRARASHARENPPQAERIRELSARRQELAHELATRAGARDDLQQELKRIESDVAVVDARVDRDRDRLQSVSSPKDAQGLEHELASLARRKSDLEDGQLDVMERLDVAEAAMAEQERLVAETNEEGVKLSDDAKAAVAEATASVDAVTRDRAAVASSLPADLLAMYERIASRGTGAALLRRATCEGCRMVLSGTDMSMIRQAAEDTVLTCPECGAILVRTEESGL